MESINIVVDDAGTNQKQVQNPEDSTDFITGQEDVPTGVPEPIPTQVADSVPASVTNTQVEGHQDQQFKGPSRRAQKNHSAGDVIGSLENGVQTRGKPRVNYRELIGNVYFTTIEPKSIKEALKDEYWVVAMQEELAQFERNEVWELVPKPSNTNVIGTKWIYKNKSDEKGPLPAIRQGWLPKGILKLRV